MKFFIPILLSIIINTLSFAQTKPKVWIYTDMSDKNIKGQEKEGSANDPDDISAMAGYLLMANMFDTKGIVVSSTHRKEHKTSPNQADWANRFFGDAYRQDIIHLNKNIGGYPDDMRFVQSCIKETAERYNAQKVYDNLENYATVKSLFELAQKETDIINVLCWGSVTEPAILVNHCLNTNRTDVLKKLRFIAHWTNSPLHQGSLEHPENVANCREDANACAYLKKMALDKKITYYECGAIGQHGIVSGSPKGEAYFNQFKISNLGRIFAEGKFAHKSVDHSDAATYWTLLGNWGVRLEDIKSDGTNTAEIEKANKEKYVQWSHRIHDELLRRAKSAAPPQYDGYQNTAFEEKNSSGTSYFDYQNPIKYGIDSNGLRDCQILRDGDWWYMTGTSYPHWARQETKENLNKGVVLYRSKDLTHWSFVKWIVPRGDSTKWYYRRFWAPEIQKIKGKYYALFNCNNDLTGHIGQHTGYAVSDKIDGDYKIVTEKHPLSNGNDLTFFEDTDGKVWAFWNRGRDFGIGFAQIDVEKGVFLTKPQTAIQPAKVDYAMGEKGDTLKVAGYDGRLIPKVAKYHDWDAIGIEGAYVIKEKDTYYLFYSSWTRGYEIGYATAKNITGPWTKSPNNPFYGAQNPQTCEKNGLPYTGDPKNPFNQVGHNAIFKGVDGRYLLSCHGIQKEGIPFLVIDPIEFDKAGNILKNSPSFTPQSVKY